MDNIQVIRFETQTILRVDKTSIDITGYKLTATRYPNNEYVLNVGKLAKIGFTKDEFKHLVTLLPQLNIHEATI